MCREKNAILSDMVKIQRFNRVFWVVSPSRGKSVNLERLISACKLFNVISIVLSLLLVHTCNLSTQCSFYPLSDRSSKSHNENSVIIFLLSSVDLHVELYVIAEQGLALFEAVRSRIDEQTHIGRNS